MAGKHRRGAEPDQDVAGLAVEPVEAAGGVAAFGSGGTAGTGGTDGTDDAGGHASAVQRSSGRATVSLLPAPAIGLGSGAVVVPGHASARRAFREERSQQARQIRLVAAVVVAVLVAAVAWFATSSGRGSGDAGKAAPVGRAQQTLLVQIVDAHQSGLGAVLLAHDRSGQGTGFGALIPATLLVNASGLGSVTLGQTTTAGGPTVGPAAVADAVGVTVDGGWVLSGTAVASLVDAVGGIDVTVDEDITQTAASGSAVVLIPAGQRHLAGQQAATFATFLDSGAPEQQRLARLSTVLQALLAKLPSSDAALSALVTPLVSPADSSMPAGRLVAKLRTDIRHVSGNAHAKDHTPGADLIYCRHHVRENDGVTQRGQQHCRAQLDAFGSARHTGEQGHGLMARARDDRITHPHGVEI